MKAAPGSDAVSVSMGRSVRGTMDGRHGVPCMVGMGYHGLSVWGTMHVGARRNGVGEDKSRFSLLSGRGYGILRMFLKEGRDVFSERN